MRASLLALFLASTVGRGGITAAQTTYGPVAGASLTTSGSAGGCADNPSVPGTASSYPSTIASSLAAGGSAPVSAEFSNPSNVPMPFPVSAYSEAN